MGAHDDQGHFHLFPLFLEHWCCPLHTSHALTEPHICYEVAQCSGDAHWCVIRWQWTNINKPGSGLTDIPVSRRVSLFVSASVWDVLKIRWSPPLRLWLYWAAFRCECVYRKTGNSPLTEHVWRIDQQSGHRKGSVGLITVFLTELCFPRAHYNTK